MSFDPAVLTQYADLVGGVIGFTLTLMALSYVFGDNGLFRLATHIFIGVSAAFAAVIVFQNVILNRLVMPLLASPADAALHSLPPLLLGLLLFSKLSPRLARLGNPVAAYLLGVGAAVALGGAIVGTIFPQVGATTALLDMNLVRTTATRTSVSSALIIFQGLIVLLGTLTTLVYFQFGGRPQADQTVRRALWVELLGRVGQFFVAVALGALFAGVLTAALLAFIERMHFLWNFVLYNIVPWILPVQ